MKLLHINSYFSTTALYEQLHAQQRQLGIDYQVYVPISQQFKEEELKVSGPNVTVSRCYHQAERYVFHLKHRKILADLEESYELDEFDLTHAHSLFSNGWLAWQLWRKYDIPYIVAVRSADVRTFFDKMPWLRPMGLSILNEARQIIFISRNTYQEVREKYIPRKMLANFQAKSIVIPNGIDEFWHQNRNEDKVKMTHRPIRLITTGQVIPRKRFVQLAEMVEAYDQNIYPMELHIIGKAVKPKIVETLNQFENVYFYGEHPKEDILSMYRQMDIFALLSDRETFGLVYPEAMSQGLPVIYTKGEGFDGFFEDLTVGVSIDEQDELAFIHAVDYIIKHYGDFVDNALWAIDEFSWPDIAKKYLEIYQNIL